MVRPFLSGVLVALTFFPLLSLAASPAPIQASPATTVSAPLTNRALVSPELAPGHTQRPALDWTAQIRAAAAQWDKRAARQAERRAPVSAPPAVLRDLAPGAKGPSVAALVLALRSRGYWVDQEKTSASAGPVMAGQVMAGQFMAGQAAPVAMPATSTLNTSSLKTLDTGLPALAPATIDRFDDRVEAVVRQAQHDWGINEDGKVGSVFYASLYATPSDVADSLRHWADEVDAAADAVWASGGTKIVVVNIPSAMLHALDLTTGRTAVESRAIVGLPNRRTPRFHTDIVGVTYNPAWYPPPSLVAIGRHYMPPGPENPLGQLLFETDNDKNIFLHDTNERELFEGSNRWQSSGCIRVQLWESLAVFVSGLDAAHIESSIASHHTRTEKFASVPVITTYSRVDTVDGRAGRYPDVYAQEKSL